MAEKSGCKAKFSEEDCFTHDVRLKRSVHREDPFQPFVLRYLGYNPHTPSPPWPVFGSRYLSP